MALPAAQTFLRWGEYLTGRIRWASGGLGQRAVGYIALLNDEIAEGMRQAFYASLPGHPDQARDSLDTIGHSRDLILYPGESQEVWGVRVRNAWEDYEQGGTPQAVLKGVDDWGKAILDLTWDSNHYLTEENWARFQVVIPFGNANDGVTIEWIPPYQYGSGRLYGPAQDYLTDSVVYGMDYLAVDIEPIALQLDLLRRTIRKWKPARSKGTVRVVLDQLSHYYGEPGLVYEEMFFGTGAVANLSAAGTINVPYPALIEGGGPYDTQDVEIGDLLLLYVVDSGTTSTPPAAWELVEDDEFFHRSRLYARIADQAYTGNLSWAITGGSQQTLAQMIVVKPPAGKTWHATIADNFFLKSSANGFTDNITGVPDNGFNRLWNFFFAATIDTVDVNDYPAGWEEVTNVNVGAKGIYVYADHNDGYPGALQLTGGSGWTRIRATLDLVGLKYAEGNFLDLKV